MLTDLYDEQDDRETVVAFSQDSCSTVSLFSTDEQEVDGEPSGQASEGAAPPPPMVSPSTVLMTDCCAGRHGASTAPLPRILAEPPSSLEPDTTIAIKLQWRLLRPSSDWAHGVGESVPRHSSSVFSLPVSNADDNVSCVGSGRGTGAASRPVMRTPTLYAVYSLGDALQEDSPLTAGEHQRKSLALRLPVGRGLLRRSLAAAREGGTESQIEEAVEPTISRRHVEVTLWFDRGTSGDPSVPPSAAISGSRVSAPERHSHLACRSFDVVDLVGDTAVAGVPLARHHRYHFPCRGPKMLLNAAATMGRGRTGGTACVPTLSLAIGQYAVLEVSCYSGDSEASFHGNEDAVLVHTKQRHPPRPTELRNRGDRGRQSRVPRGEGQAVQASHRSETIVSSTETDPVEVLISGGDAAPHQLPRRRRATAGGEAPDNGAKKAPAGRSGSSGASNHLSLQPTSRSSSTSSSGSMGSLWDSTWSETLGDNLVGDHEAAAAANNNGGSSAVANNTAALPPGRLTAEREVHPRPTVGDDGKVTVFTTGIRLDDTEESQCRKLGLVVNPALAKAQHAWLLVAQRPLQRSVKLLTVLPYVQAVVGRQWFDKALEAQDPTLDPTPYVYQERRTSASIEGENNFTLADTMAVPPHVRQQLFKEFVFWVHPKAKPQEPPSNDLRTVIRASGGSITKRVRQANVVVVPDRRVTKTLTSQLAKDMSPSQLSDAPAMVIPDDIFRAVLGQRRLETSVDVEAALSQMGTGRGSERRRPSATPRRSTAIAVGPESQKKAPRRSSTGGKTTTVPSSLSRKRTRTASSATTTQQQGRKAQPRQSTKC